MDIKKVDKSYQITISEREANIFQELMINISNNHAFNRYQPFLNEIVKQIKTIKN